MADALVTVNQTWEGEYMANVLGFSNMEEDANFLQDFADNFRFTWGATITNNLSASWAMDNLTVGFIDGGNISFSVDVDFSLGPLGGADNGDVTARQICLLQSLNYVGPKPNRGRIYFGGFTEDQINNGRWDTGVNTAFREMVEDWADGIAVQQSSVFLRIVGRPESHGGIYVSSPVQLVVGRRIPATQRRRRLSD